MLEEKEWITNDLDESLPAVSYLSDKLNLSEKETDIIVSFHLAGVNNHVLTKKSIVKNGDLLSVSLPDLPPEPMEDCSTPLDILYEDESILVVNKARGMVVQPAPGHWTGSLYSCLRHYLPGEDPFIGIVHRLDISTSGCLLVAKNKSAARSLSEQIQSKQCRRIYQGIVHGTAESEGVINAPIGRDPHNFRHMAVTDIESRPALTRYKRTGILGEFSEMEFHLETGRTHQIRVHSAYIGHPLLGDDLYGVGSETISGAVLHARSISFRHPVTGEIISVTAETPLWYLQAKEQSVVL